MNLCLAMAMHNEEEELDCFRFAMAMQKAEDSSLADERLAMSMEDLNGKKFVQVAKLGDDHLLTWHGLKVVENEWANWENWTMMYYDKESLSWQLMTKERQLIAQIAFLQRDEMERQRWINDEAERQLMNAEEVAMGNDGCQQEQEPSLPQSSGEPWKAKFIPRAGDTAGQKLRHYKDKHNEREYRRKLRRAMAKAIAAAESPGDVSRDPSPTPTEIGDEASLWNLIGQPSEDDHFGLADRAAVWHLIGM